MTIEFFCKNYDVNDLCIKKAYIANNKLYLVTVLQPHLDLIANGYRPSLDMSIEKTFIFDVIYEDEVFEGVRSISIDSTALTINDNKINLSSNQISFK